MSFITYVNGLDGGIGMCFDNSGNLYIANTTGNNIIKVDKLGNKTTFASGFNYTENVVFDNTGFPIGYLYVMDSTNTIYKVDVNGTKTAFITNLTDHYLGMCIDNFNNLYYTSSDQNIYKIDTSGVTSTFISGTYTPYPQSIARDSTGNFYITGNNEYISKYSSSGVLINSQFISSSSGDYWYWVTIDNSDNIYGISGGSFFNLNKYDPSGSLLSNIYTSSNLLLSVAIDKSNKFYFTNDNGIEVLTLGPTVCFKENTKILTDTGYKNIEELRKGHLIKTENDGFKKIEVLGKKTIYNSAVNVRIKDQLYKCCQNEYPELFEDLVITGSHSILVDELDATEREMVIEVLGKIYITGNKYRLPVCVDKRSSVYEIPGNYTIYHIALENSDYYMNYGIYANGLLVETCSKRYLKELADMNLID